MSARKYPAAVREVAETLKCRYHDFNHYNRKDPLDELLFIMCITKTGEASYRSTFRALKETFPTHLQIAEAPAEYIARPIAIVEPEIQGDTRPSRHHRGAVW